MKGKELAITITHLIDDKKGENIICLYVGKHSTLVDYFIIATGLVDTHVKAIAENMIVELKKQSITPIIQEGFDTGTWLCVDYGDVIVHIMREKEREFYNLESIWGACPKETF